MSAIPDHTGHASVVSWLRTRVEHREHAVAFTCVADGERDETHLTWIELDRRARAIAAALRERMERGDRAILIYPTGLDFVEAFWGCLYAGIVAVPVPEPFHPRQIARYRAVLADAGTDRVLTTGALEPTLEQWFGSDERRERREWVATDRIRSAWADRWRLPDLAHDRLAFIQYTSGSTGRPRGVMITQGNLLANCRMLTRWFAAGEGTAIVSWLPLFHDMGLVGKLSVTSYAGSHCVMMPPFAFLQKPVRWLAAISRYAGEISGSPDFGYALAARKVGPEQLESLDLSTWRMAPNGSEPVRASTLRRFYEVFRDCGFRGESFRPSFGMAETTLFVSGGPRETEPTIRQFDAESYATRRLAPVRYGEPAVTTVGCGETDHGDQIVRIVDPETHVESAADEVGEIWIAGSHVSVGYWNKLEETAATFGARIEGTGEGPFFRTGDLGFLHDGQLYIAGRIKDLIIIDGNNHYPQDIELTVENAHPAIRKGASAAFSVDHGDRECLVVMAEVDLPVGSPVTREELERGIRQAIAEEHGIRLEEAVFLRRSTIEKTSSGKIARGACRTSYLNGTLVPDFA
jgi:acyl-CoA synthetase (AMP-forming)/AMP-acid ligase II